MSKRHLSKIIFKKLAAILHITELQTYCKYLENALDFRLDFRALSQHIKTDVTLAKQFYGGENEPPKFFDYKSCFDWARLNNNIMPKSECLSLYLEKSIQGHSNQKKYIKIYDETCITRLFYPELRIRRHIFILSKHRTNNDLEVNYINDQSFWHIYPEVSEMDGILKKSVKSFQISECLNDILCKTNAQKVDLIPPNCNFDMISSNVSLFNRLDRPLVICTHTGNDLKKTALLGHSAVKPSNMHFSSLAIFNETNKNFPLVICVTLPQDTDMFLAYQPTELIGKEIVSYSVKSPGRVTGINDYLENLASETKKTNQKSDAMIEKWWSKYLCRCDCCILAKNEYSSNISLYGTQPRVGINLDTVEYITIFGLKNPANMQRLMKVYALSVSALDIESYTKKLANKSSAQMSNLSFVGEKTRAVAVQEISLIGYGDSFLENCHTKIFEVLPRCNTARSVVDSFVGYVLERQKFLQRQKESLLHPFFEFVKIYKIAHTRFWLNEFKNENDQKAISRQIKFSYENSLAGKFEAHLGRLKRSMYCFAFNGGRYDFPLLHKHLAASLKGRGFKKPLNTIKRDSKILRLSIPTTGIRFVDICDHIGPGSSLASFAKMTNQKEEKMIFPFSAFDSLDFLKREHLPTDKSEWFNDLKHEQTPDADIEKAHADFTRIGAKNIGDYLKSYLRIDVELLGKGVITYFRSLFDKYEVHSLDIDATTISSYSSYLFQHHLMKNKRIATFSPNLLPLYGCLRSASTGGLTMVMRHSADGNNDREAPINSHLSERHNLQGVGVASFDVSSLYPSAALFDLNFGPGIFTFKCQDDDTLSTTKAYDRHSQYLMNSSESQVVQYLSLVRYPDALRIYSQYHAGPGQICYSKSFKKRVDVTLVLQPSVLKIIQYHDTYSHVNNKSSHDVNCKFHRDGKQLDYNKDTLLSDDQNYRYAKWITENVPNLTMTYEVVNECEFFHDNPLKEKPDHTSPIEYLRKFHPQDSVFKPDWLEFEKTFDSSFLIDKILRTSECDAGFVVLAAGAKESADDEVSDLFGFCLQKNSPTPDEIGPEAKKLAQQIVRKKIFKGENEDDTVFQKRVDDAVNKYLLNRLKTKFTLTRKSFTQDQCLPVIYFKFLVEKRKLLPTVRIMHYLHYEGRDYASSFIRRMLQCRHDLIKIGLKDSLESQNDKLTANSAYGGFMKQQNKYHKYTYALGENLKEKSIVNAMNISLISAVPSKNQNFSLMYLLKYKQTTAKINNLLQIGATILGYSRAIFYSQIYNLLNLLDSRKAELCYCDTDSIMLFLSSANLRECVKEGRLDEFEQIHREIFVDPRSDVTQAGRLKLEGFYQSGFFRSVKSYVLNPFPNDDTKRVVKSKGIAKIIREKLPNEAFYIDDKQCHLHNPKRGQKRKQEDMFFQSLCLHPTMGDQIFLSVKRRRMANAINCKRLLTRVGFT